MSKELFEVKKRVPPAEYKKEPFEFEQVDKIIQKNSFVQEALEEIRNIDEGVTLRHSMETAEMVASLADELHFSREEKKSLIIVALTHDVGKAFIKRDVLIDKEKYDDKKIAEMDRHIRLSAEYLEGKGAPSEILEIVIRHHQHKGKPRDPENKRRKNENNGELTQVDENNAEAVQAEERRMSERRQEKPNYERLARIFSIVDIFQATGDSARPYNNHEEALSIRDSELGLLGPLSSAEQKAIIFLRKNEELKRRESKK